MGIDINFGALQAPNPFGAYAQGQEYGQQRRLQQAQREAGNLFSTDPEGAAQRLASAGDIQGAMVMNKFGREARQDKARTSAVDAYTKGDVKGAQAAAVGAGDFDLASAIGKMDEGERAQAKERADKFAAIGLGLKGRPYTERRAIIQQIAPSLIEQGMKPEDIQAFDPTDENIAGFTAQAMSVKELIDKADKDRTFNETHRHNVAGEANAAGQLGVARGNLGVRQQEFKAREAAGGFGTPGVGAAPGTAPHGAWEEF